MDEWDDDVEHPRNGRGPRSTGLDVASNGDAAPGRPLVKPHWLNRGRVPGTAIVADVSRQVVTTMGVTHDYDLRRECRDCGRPFLFFAAEQKHWHEELGFTQGSDRVRARYEVLIGSARSLAEDEELARHCLALMEAGLFSPRKGEQVRRLAKRTPAKQARRLLRRLQRSPRSAVVWVWDEPAAKGLAFAGLGLGRWLGGKEPAAGRDIVVVGEPCFHAELPGSGLSNQGVEAWGGQAARVDDVLLTVFAEAQRCRGLRCDGAELQRPTGCHAHTLR